jgi:hypothetical protein
MGRTTRSSTAKASAPATKEEEPKEESSPKPVKAKKTEAKKKGSAAPKKTKETTSKAVAAPSLEDEVAPIVAGTTGSISVTIEACKQ